MSRHSAGDWGDVGLEDWQANDPALKDGSRILSTYRTKNGERFWMITEPAELNASYEGFAAGYNAFLAKTGNAKRSGLVPGTGLDIPHTDPRGPRFH